MTIKQKVINSSNILQYITSYNSKYNNYGVGRTFFDKLSFPDKRTVLNKKIIEVQLKEEVTRQSLEVNVKGYTDLLKNQGFPAVFDTTTTSKYEINIGNFKIRFLKPKNIQKDLPTEIQERGAVFVFNQSLKEGVDFKQWKDILSHKETKEGLEHIFKPWGEVPDQWVNSYFKQQEKLFKVIGKSGWEKIEYNEPKSVMNEIRELIKTVTIDSKNVKYENWNPSDIWIVKDKEQVLKELKGSVITSSNSQTLKEINDRLLSLIKEKRLIGVSLKKVPDNREKAKFIYVNYSSRKSITFNLLKYNKNAEIDLNLKYNPNSKNDLMTESTMVKIDKYSLQIKSNSGSSRDSGLKFESGIPGSGGRGGKAPLDYISTLMKDYKIGKLLNDWKKFPSTEEEFAKNTSLERVFNKLKASPNINLGVNNYKDFYDSMVALYGEEEEKWHRVARIKIMEMMFIYQTTKLNTKQYNEFWKDLIYLSVKEGSKFAPHGKLY
jgi:hypothetical protein